MFKIKNILQFLGLLLSSIIVVLNLWTISLLFSNCGNVICDSLLFNKFGNFFLSILIGASYIAFSRMNNLSFWFLPLSLFLLVTSLFVIVRKIIYLLINLYFSFFSFIFFLGKKIKLSFYPIIIFFIIILLEGNFSYASCSNDLPVPNSGGSPTEAIIVFIFCIIFAYISVNHNNYISKIDGSKNFKPLDLNETEKNLLESLPIKETNKISNLSLSDEILSNKFINLAIVVYCFFIIGFVIYEYLYPKFTKKVTLIKKLKKKWEKI